MINFPIIGDIYHRLNYRVIREKASLGLCAMDIETYNVCNLRCVMCSYPKMTREKVRMSMESFKKIINDAATSGVREICLSNCNEPLLDPMLFERIRYAKSKGLQVRFVTNGTLLTKDKVDEVLDSGLDSIDFSFDGATKRTYEAIRVGANFEETRNNIIQLIKERDRRGLAKPSVTIYLVIQKGNWYEVERFKSFWMQFADGVSSTPVHRGYERLLPKELQSKEIKPRHLYPCRSLFKTMIVLSSGKVALCCVDYDGSSILGDLTKQTINEVWNSRNYKEIRELHLSGQGDKVKLCKEKKCRQLYRDSSYNWWTHE